MRPDGSHRRRLGVGVDPAFSRNGRLIAYTVCDGVQSDLMVMRSDGSNARAVLATDSHLEAVGRSLVTYR